MPCPHSTVEQGPGSSTKKKRVGRKPGPKPSNKNNLKKSISSVNEKLGCARAKAADERTAQALAFAKEWVQITEEELSGLISGPQALHLRSSWQSRVGALSSYQQKRCHLRVDKCYDEWLADKGLQARLDQPFIDALESMEMVRPSDIFMRAAVALLVFDTSNMAAVVCRVFVVQKYRHIRLRTAQLPAAPDQGGHSSIIQ